MVLLAGSLAVSALRADPVAARQGGVTGSAGHGVAAGTRFLVDGAEVCDRLSGLRWQRCALGQRWDAELGCVGIARKLWWPEAQAAVPAGWRLPRLAELQALLAGPDGALHDAAVFPDLPATWFWTIGEDVRPIPWGPPCGDGANETCERGAARAVWWLRIQAQPGCLAERR